MVTHVRHKLKQLAMHTMKTLQVAVIILPLLSILAVQPYLLSVTTL